MSIVNKAIKNLNPIWKKALINELKSEYFQLLTETLDCEKEKFNVLPSIDMIFNSLNSTLINDIKVVIIGQDPYFNKGQANGLCFSVRKDKPLPPSLKNIFTCLKNDINSTVLNHGDLSNWANQGVLLLNSCLTVREGVANSHKNIGWQKFTDAIIQLISKKNDGVCFFLWGNYAIKKEKLIDNSKHLILKASHPSPLSAYRGFLDCKHFSKANEFILNRNERPIDWNIY